MRHAGGSYTWIAIGYFHTTCIFDYDTKVVTVTDGVPCNHGMNECHSHPNSPHYRDGPAR